MPKRLSIEVVRHEKDGICDIRVNVNDDGLRDRCSFDDVNDFIMFMRSKLYNFKVCEV